MSEFEQQRATFDSSVFCAVKPAGNCVEDHSAAFCAVERAENLLIPRFYKILVYKMKRFAIFSPIELVLLHFLQCIV
ncbi:hypothetical protein [Paenibacillus albidus]|uniref:hypothetical protein n=1 Tax=Paenibacillus albidus TaxID=2041023 RepID=UPI00166841EF|nr:hypothetical protein [Paenibacillus albidus]